MNKTLKIGLTIAFIAVVIISIFVWRIFGQPYYRISLIGTEYIENADELNYANEQLDNKLILIKKYMYSKDVMLIGFGGGGSRTDDYFSYGIADNNKNILIEPKYQFISSKTSSKKEPIIFGLPYVKEGSEKMMFYKIADGKLELINEKASW
tara:strand:+ start:209 stop:664 length:456 start_codon:yes stop_codon:yes gene_type:complete